MNILKKCDNEIIYLRISNYINNIKDNSKKIYKEVDNDKFYSLYTDKFIVTVKRFKEGNDVNNEIPSDEIIKLYQDNASNIFDIFEVFYKDNDNIFKSYLYSGKNFDYTNINSNKKNNFSNNCYICSKQLLNDRDALSVCTYRESYLEGHYCYIPEEVTYSNHDFITKYNTCKKRENNIYEMLNNFNNLDEYLINNKVHKKNL